MDAKIIKKVIESVVLLVIIIVSASILIGGNASVVLFLYFGLLLCTFFYRKHAATLAWCAALTPPTEVGLMYLLSWLKSGVVVKFTTILATTHFYSEKTMWASYIFWCIVLPVVVYRASQLWGKQN